MNVNCLASLLCQHEHMRTSEDAKAILHCHEHFWHGLVDAAELEHNLL